MGLTKVKYSTKIYINVPIPKIEYSKTNKKAIGKKSEREREKRRKNSFIF